MQNGRQIIDMQGISAEIALSHASLLGFCEKEQLKRCNERAHACEACVGCLY